MKITEESEDKLEKEEEAKLSITTITKKMMLQQLMRRKTFLNTMISNSYIFKLINNTDNSEEYIEDHDKSDEDNEMLEECTMSASFSTDSFIQTDSFHIIMY